MAGLSTGLKKLLTITACGVDKKAGITTPLSGDDNRFEVMLNPSEFSHERSIIYSTDNAGSGCGSAKDEPIGKAAVTPDFQSYGDETVGFSLVIDGTGVVNIPQPAPGGSPDVATQIKNLNKVVYVYDQEEHEPRVVQLLWGSFKFNCRLKSMSVQYTLFKPSGQPLRAKLSLSFIGYMSPAEEAKKADRKSPDLTKVVEVKAGDTLPALCYRVYNDSSYYTQVARVNNLVSFRGLKPGSQIVFPPLR